MHGPASRTKMSVDLPFFMYHPRPNPWHFYDVASQVDDMEKAAVDYPVNALRNMALSRATTELVRWAKVLNNIICLRSHDSTCGDMDHLAALAATSFALLIL